MVSNLKLPSVPSQLYSDLPCLHGWQADSRLLSPAASRRSIPLELVHSDLHGPLPAYCKWLQVLDLIH
jgi:hypothetical protein